MNRVLLIVWGLAALSLTACNGASDAGEAAGQTEPADSTTVGQPVSQDTAAADPTGKEEEVKLSPIESRDWTVIGFTFDGQDFQPVGEVSPLLRFVSGRVSGTTGCNDFNAPYELGEGSSLSIGNIATTKKMCSNIMPQERRLLELLRGVSGYELLSRTVLEIRSGKGKITLKTEQPVEGDYE